MIIRQMTINDYDDVLRLWKKTAEFSFNDSDSKESIGKLLKRNPYISLVCQFDNRVIAAVISGCDGRVGHIYRLDVEKEFRVRGIGLELIKEVIKKLRAEGIDKCYFYIADNNYDDKEFWDDTGWQKEKQMLIYSRSI